MFQKFGGDRPYVVGKISSGWRNAGVGDAFLTFPIQLLLNLFKLNLLLGKAREEHLEQWFCKCNFFCLIVIIQTAS